MHQRIQNLIHHTEVLFPHELLLYVQKILVHRIEPPRHQLTDMQTDEWRRLEKGARILDDMKNARLQRPHCCRMVPSKQSRQFTKHRPGLSRRGNTNAVLYDLDSTLNQEPKQICPSTLLDDHLACAKAPDVVAVNEFQDRRHGNLIENCAVSVSVQTPRSRGPLPPDDASDFFSACHKKYAGALLSGG
jgi:hypothetical protein